MTTVALGSPTFEIASNEERCVELSTSFEKMLQAINQEKSVSTWWNEE
jgi:hypothetical protein